MVLKLVKEIQQYQQLRSSLNSNRQQKGTYSKQLLLLRSHCNAIRTAMIITKTLVRLELHIVKVLVAKADMVDILNAEGVENVEEEGKLKEMQDVDNGIIHNTKATKIPKKIKQRVSLSQMKSFKQYLKSSMPSYTRAVIKWKLKMEIFMHKGKLMTTLIEKPAELRF
jgi:hypothetical protein